MLQYIRTKINAVQQTAYIWCTNYTDNIKSGVIFDLGTIVSSQACIGVVKQLSDSSVAWTTAYSGMPAVKSLAVDSSDQYIYVGKYENPFVVIQLNTIDGSFASAQSM